MRRLHSSLEVGAMAFVLVACSDVRPPMRDTAARPVVVTPAPVVATRAAPPQPDSIARPLMPLVPRPDTVRGLYVNRWVARGTRMWDLIDAAKRTEVNALVIDVKDDRGLMLYRSVVPAVDEIKADTLQPLSYKRVRSILDSMRTYGIYPIARIVVAKDPLLASGMPRYAIKRRDDSTASWRDKNGQPWLDPTHPEVWKYAADIAAEAVRMGFSELQFDYVRFPDEDRIVKEGMYARMNGRVRAKVIRDQLAYLRSLVKPLHVPMTIDVFGLTATDTTDMGIGQRWEDFVDEADVVLPMVYPSHFAAGTYRITDPNAHPYQTVNRALKDILHRSAGVPGAARIVPWYQDFTLGPPHYTAAEVKAQMLAGSDNGIPGWMLWNPRSDYHYDALKPDSTS
jgi:hypothetical protein